MAATSRPRGAALAVAGLAALAAVGLFLFPVATLSRSFGGEGALLVHPGRIVDFTGFLPQQLPDFAVVTGLGWALLAALVVLAGLAYAGSRWLTVAGAGVVVLTALLVAAFVRAVDVAQLPLLAGGLPYRRLPFQAIGPNLGAFLAALAGLAAVVAGLAREQRWASTLARLRGGLVPAVALLLSIAVGGVVILAIEPTPAETLARAWFAKVDLLWYSYSTLFGPVLPRFRPAFDPFLTFQSLALATPLIFTGLALALAFRSGLFNIGAPGQIVLGGIFAAAVGIYLPLPAPLLGPLSVAAAALGGALWGAIPGLLKARFGSSEVINTIMLNYIASSLLVFLIGSNEATFFGRTISLPFKAPGGEAKSLELAQGARLNPLVELLGLRSGENVVNLAAPLAVLGLVLGLLAWRGPLRRRLGPALGLGLLGLVLGLVLFPRVSLSLSSSLASVRLNPAFLIALAAAVFYGVFMWRTRYGYALRAVGLAPKAAEYGGVNIGRNVVLAMALSGALAGLAASHYVLGGALEEYRLKQSVPSDAAGFGGITVALLGANTPAGVVAAATLFGVLGTGGLNLDQALERVSRDIVTVLQALIVLFIATNGFLGSRLRRPVPSEPAASYPEAGAGGSLGAGWSGGPRP